MLLYFAGVLTGIGIGIVLVALLNDDDDINRGHPL